MIKIMPCLDMKNGRVVKGIHFVDIKDAGDPAENAARYQQEGADELAMLDIAATLDNRKTRLEWVRNVAGVIEIPLTVGGGISTLQDIELLFEAGADKVSMNSAAVMPLAFSTREGMSMHRTRKWIWPSRSWRATCSEMGCRISRSKNAREMEGERGSVLIVHTCEGGNPCLSA